MGTQLKIIIGASLRPVIRPDAQSDDWAKPEIEVPRSFDRGQVV